MQIELGSIEHNKRVLTKAIEGILDELKIRDVDTTIIQLRSDSLIRAIDSMIEINGVDEAKRLCPLKKTQQRLCTGQCKHCKGDNNNGN